MWSAQQSNLTSEDPKEYGSCNSLMKTRHWSLLSRLRNVFTSLMTWFSWRPASGSIFGRFVQGLEWIGNFDFRLQLAPSFKPSDITPNHLIIFGPSPASLPALPEASFVLEQWSIRCHRSFYISCMWRYSRYYLNWTKQWSNGDVMDFSGLESSCLELISSLSNLMVCVLFDFSWIENVAGKNGYSSKCQNSVRFNRLGCRPNRLFIWCNS